VRARFKGYALGFRLRRPPRLFEARFRAPLNPIAFVRHRARNQAGLVTTKETAMSSTERAPRRDIHAEITGKLIAAIEADPGKPSMPWRKSSAPLFMPSNALTGNAYNGINIVSLWVAAECLGYTAPVWATYRQWSELGAQVRKGEKSSLVVFYKEYEADPNPDVSDDAGKRRVARASYVFNASQVDGYTLPDAPTPLGPIERLEAVDRFIAATGARIEHGGDRAFYRPSTDHIQMPDEGLFCGTDTLTRTEGYYAKALTHWTAAPTRLGRELGKRFGDAAYAAEELVAEIASASLCSELGITQDTRADHAQYLAQWPI
jgi:antirestriction protein ArdC